MSIEKMVELLKEPILEVCDPDGGISDSDDNLIIDSDGEVIIDIDNMAKRLNDPTITDKTELATTDRIPNFQGADGEIFYQSRNDFIRDITGTKLKEKDANAVKIISDYGMYVHTGTGSDWTVNDGLPGIVRLVHSGTGQILLTITSSKIGDTMYPGDSISIAWDGSEYVPV